jgi:hypothetical protein
MRQIFSYIFLLSIFSNAYAEIGYVYEADLNGDGISDSLRSGPNAMFGNAFGPFMLSLSKPDGTFVKKVIGLHPRATALESNGQESRIWGYIRGGLDEGSLCYTKLDGSFEENCIDMYLGKKDNHLSRELYDLILDENKIVKFIEIENYVPPKYEWGR